MDCGVLDCGRENIPGKAVPVNELGLLARSASFMLRSSNGTTWACCKQCVAKFKSVRGIKFLPIEEWNRES